MFTIRFNRKRTEGYKTAIVIIIRFQGKAVKRPTGISLPPQNWDPRRERARIPDEPEREQATNDMLTKIRSKLTEIILKTGRIPTATECKILQLSIQSTVELPDIIQAMNEYGEKLRKEGKAERSAQTYQTLATNLVRYHKAKNRKEKQIEDIQPEYIQSFSAYLIGQGYADSHTHKMIKVLHTVLKWKGAKINLAQARPPKLRYPDAIYLNQEEINQIRTVELSQFLSHIRNIFLIAYYTGQRYSDIEQIIGQTGNIITVTQQKTGAKVSIPRKPELDEILKRINSNEVPTNQYINRAIKEIGQIAGICENVQIATYRGGQKEIVTGPKYEFITSHTARRSFATNAILAGISAEIVMKFTGHKSYNEFQKYLRASSLDIAESYLNHPFFQKNAH